MCVGLAEHSSCLDLGFIEKKQTGQQIALKELILLPKKGIFHIKVRVYPAFIILQGDKTHV